MTTNMAKAPPTRKSSEPTMMNGAAYFLSCAWRPGDEAHGGVRDENRDDETHARGAQAPHDPRAELAQVGHERHLAEGALLLGIGRRLRVGHHHSVRKCRSAPTPRPRAKPSRMARVT